TVFATGFNVPIGLEFDILGTGNLYVANNGGNSISRVGPAGGAASLYSTNVPFAFYLAMQVPEPSSLLLCAAAVLAFGVARGRAFKRLRLKRSRPDDGMLPEFPPR